MKKIPLQVPDIITRDIEAMCDVIRTGQLVQGPYVADFEGQISEYTGSGYAVAFSSGTATLHAALVALEIGHGAEVIVPAFSHVATANVVELVGARPIFVDICLDDFNLDSSLLEEKISKKTRAIIPVHEFGLSCDLSSVMAIAKAYKLHVIEDAACALGATFDDQHVGTFGDFGSISFHPRKAITSGEGGILITNAEDLAESLRQLRSHGFSHKDHSFRRPGFNYRMTDFQAAILRSQFDRFSHQLEKKRKLAELYEHYLTDAVTKPSEPQGRFHTYQTYHIILPTNVTRDEIIRNMKNKGIGTNFGAHCIPDLPYYREKYHLDPASQFPNAKRAHDFGLALPLYASLVVDDIILICKTLNREVK